MTNGTTGQIDYQSTNANQVVNDAIGNLTQGQSILFSSGTYNLHGSITGMYEDNITLVFANGATLFVANGMNTPAISLTYCDNWVIQGVTIDGNAANQDPSKTPHGIYLWGCTNCLVDEANIYNCRVFGFFAQGTGSVNDGIQNSKITFCGWNGITLGMNYGELGLYAINNEVAYCSDVGITNYGIGDIITGNYVHDVNGTTGYNNSRWGIAAEGSGDDIITGNTIYNVNMGIVLSVGVNCTVSQNIIYNWDTYNWGVPAIQICTKNNIITQNQLLYTGTYADESGISIEGGGEYILGIYNNTVSTNEVACGSNSYAITIGSGATSTTISGNNITAVYTINDAGTDTKIFNNPGYNPVGYISSPISSGGITLVDKGSGSTWVSGTTYTNWESPKILYISGGTVTAIVYDGQTLYTSTTTCSITLQPGDTFSVTFTTAPTINVIGQ